MKIFISVLMLFFIGCSDSNKTYSIFLEENNDGYKIIKEEQSDSTKVFIKTKNGSTIFLNESQLKYEQEKDSFLFQVLEQTKLKTNFFKIEEIKPNVEKNKEISNETLFQRFESIINSSVPMIIGFIVLGIFISFILN